MTSCFRQAAGAQARDFLAGGTRSALSRSDRICAVTCWMSVVAVDSASPIRAMIRLQGISGIDPISESGIIPFFACLIPRIPSLGGRAVRRRLIGQSPNHYYLLDQGLKSAFASRAPACTSLVAMITEFAGAPPDDPSRSSMAAPYYVEHLFHIDRAWSFAADGRLGYVPGAEILHFELPFNYLFIKRFERPASGQLPS